MQLDERGRSSGQSRVERGRPFERELAHDLEVRSGAPHALPRHALEEHRAHAEQVAAPIELLAERLLRRHVRHLALDLAGARLVSARVEFGDAEIEDLHLAAVRDHDVVRTDVTVHDVKRQSSHVAQLVGGVQPVAGFGQHEGHDRRIEPLRRIARARRGEHPRQRFARDVFHREKELSVQIAIGECVYDVPVSQERGEARLAQEHFFVARIARAAGEQRLQRNDPVEAVRALGAFERDLDVAHAPPTDDEERAIARVHAAPQPDGARRLGGKRRDG